MTDLKIVDTLTVKPDQRLIGAMKLLGTSRAALYDAANAHRGMLVVLEDHLEDLIHKHGDQHDLGRYEALRACMFKLDHVLGRALEAYDETSWWSDDLGEVGSA